MSLTKFGLLTERKGKKSLRWADYPEVVQYIKDEWEAGNGWAVIGKELCEGEDFEGFPGVTKKQLTSKMQSLGCTPITGKGSNDSSTFQTGKITRKRKHSTGTGGTRRKKRRTSFDNNGGRKDAFVLENHIKEKVYAVVPKRSGCKLGLKIKGTDENAVISVTHTRTHLSDESFRRLFTGQNRKASDNTNFGMPVEKLMETNGYENYGDVIESKDSKEEKKEFFYKERNGDSFDIVIPVPVKIEGKLTFKQRHKSCEGLVGLTFPIKTERKKKLSNLDREMEFESSDDEIL